MGGVERDSQQAGALIKQLFSDAVGHAAGISGLS